MGEVIYIGKAKVYQEVRPKRRAYIEPFPDPILFGTHGQMAKTLYKMEPEEPLPTTLEYIIAAVGG